MEDVGLNLSYSLSIYPLYFYFSLRGRETGAVILRGYIFLYLTEGRMVICLKFYGWGEREDSGDGYLCYLLEKRLGNLIESLWNWDLWVLG